MQSPDFARNNVNSGDVVIVAHPRSMLRGSLIALINSQSPSWLCVPLSDPARLLEVIEPYRGVATILLHVDLLINDGVHSIIEVKKKYPQIVVCLLARDGRSSDVGMAIRAGLSGVMLEDDPAEGLSAALSYMKMGGRLIPVQLFSSAIDVGHPKLERLTYREREVLQKLKLGEPNKEIARALCIEEATVKLHLRSIFRKLKVRNRTEAALVASEVLQA